MELEQTLEAEADLPPEYCHYKDEGCELAKSCLNCPFPGCIYDEPGGSQSAIIADSFSWDEVGRLYDSFIKLEDMNIGSVAQAEARGEVYLRKAGLEAAGGYIKIPVNCGQQVYDVIDISDSRAGLDAARKRLLGISLYYDTGRGEYRQRLLLGAV